MVKKEPYTNLQVFYEIFARRKRRVREKKKIGESISHNVVTVT